MTQLLVSVRSAEEAEAALRGGADLIDVKEPSLGSLGAAPPDVCRRVLDVVGDRAPVSMALGELVEARRAVVPRGMRLAKLGLSGAARRADWPSQWQARFATLPGTTRGVAVVYADWQRCQAPSPAEVLRAAGGLDCEALLIDTHGKDRGDLFTHQDEDQLRSLCAAARRQNLRVVLAGSLRASSFARALRLQPDVLAVRGAVCEAHRGGRLVPEKVAQLAELLAAHPEPPTDRVGPPIA